MLAPKLCDYGDVHILVKRTITIARVTDAEQIMVIKRLCLNTVRHLLGA